MKKTQQFIADKFTEKWISENKDLLDDYYEICYKVLTFKALWGIDIGIMLETSKQPEGRII